MIRFFKWLGIAILATFVFTFAGVVGFIVGQYKYLRQRGAKGYGKYLIDMIGGIFTGASHIFEGYAIGIDVMACAAGGEGIEYVCHKDKTVDLKTLLGVPDATISAGIGDINQQGKLDTKFGIGLDKALNRSFNQKNHGLYALIAYRDRKQRESEIEPYQKES